MIELIRRQQGAVIKLCERYRVRSLEVFGSALDETQFCMADSDLDFLVEFLPLEPGAYADNYFGLLEGLGDIFDRNVDLVMVRAIKNPYFLEVIKQKRELVYAA